MSKILVVVQSYPSMKRDPDELTFVHPRILEYLKQGYYVDVLSFSANNDYFYNGVHVYSRKSIQNNLRLKTYDVVMFHSPNLRKHILFLIKNFSKLKNIIFIFHGHEVLRVNKYYYKPYSFDKKTKFKRLILQMYDPFKIFILKRFFVLCEKWKNIKYIFVSEYLRKVFAKEFNFSLEKVKNKSIVVNNPVHNIFINSTYRPEKEFIADFIILRPYDRSEFRIDKICEIAEMNPQVKFHVHGCGRYFNFNKCPNNLKIINEYYDQNQIPHILNKYKCALMLSEHDTQGVMSCEMATYGIPLITSSTPAAEEMFIGFKNVKLIDHNRHLLELKDFLDNINQVDTTTKNRRFSLENTVHKEIKLVNDILDKTMVASKECVINRMTTK